MKIISSYFGNRILRHVAEDMKQLSRDSFTGVIHTFSENDHKYYSGSFRDIVKASHDAGLDVDLDPWGVGHVFGGEAFSAWITEHPECLQVSRDGHRKPIACLNSPGFKGYMKSWIDSAHSSGADGLFWDEPHLHIVRRGDPEQSWTCACPICLDLFRNRYGCDMPTEMTGDVKQFRMSTIIDFLKEMLHAGKNAGMRNTVCVLPPEFGGAETSCWDDIAKLDGIDIIATDPYWQIARKDAADFVARYSNAIKEIATRNNLEPQIWIQGFRIPSGSESEIAIAIKTAWDAGIRNLAIWGFDACGHMSWLKCGNSDLAWKTAVDTFSLLHE